MNKLNPKNFIGIIPAAGRGTRLGLPFPKELYPIATKGKILPIAQATLLQMTKAGIEHCVFIVNEYKHQLIQYFGNGNEFDCKISYIQQSQFYYPSSQSTSPGLAQALNSCFQITKDKWAVFGMPDTLIIPENAFALALQEVNITDDVLLLLFLTDHPEKFGMVKLDEQEKILEIVDKPHKTDLQWMWGGIIWSPKFTRLLNYCVDSRNLQDFATILNIAINEQLVVRGIKFNSGKFFDLGTYDDIVELRNWIDIV